MLRESATGCSRLRFVAANAVTPPVIWWDMPIAASGQHGSSSRIPIRCPAAKANNCVAPAAPVSSTWTTSSYLDGACRYLLAADAGSNQISVLRIRPDGSLRPVEGSPVSSGGISPVSIAVYGNLVYLANNGSGGSNYTGFTLNPGGYLHPLTGSTVSLPGGSLPGDVLFNGDGTHLVGTRIGTSLIDSFVVRSDGRLTPAPGSPFPAQRIGPFGSEFSPTDPTQLYVSNAHDGPNLGSISASNVTGNGTLDTIAGSPYPDDQTAPCWIEITHDGRFLFTVNTAVPSISRYQIRADGSLTLLGSTPFNHPAGLGPEDARLGPQGGMLWVVDTPGRAVSVFAVSGGNLTELPSSPTPLPSDVAPFGIIVN
jgi:hypothetical protein